jgi:hypothetical protein
MSLVLFVIPGPPTLAGFRGAAPAERRSCPGYVPPGHVGRMSDHEAQNVIVSIIAQEDNAHH